MDETTRLTGHNWQTVKNTYINEDCSSGNGHYDRRMPSKLAPYEQEVIEMGSQYLLCESNGAGYYIPRKCLCRLIYRDLEDKRHDWEAIRGSVKNIRLLGNHIRF